METIFKRVSMRRYQDKAVEKEKLEKLVRAGMAAPSAGNQQPWEFYVVTRKDLLAELSNTSKYSICVKDAAAAIIPCFRTSAEALMFKECVQLDMSAATENILLEAVELGLGAVWLGVAPVEERMAKVRKCLSLPQDVEAFSIISVGYPAYEKEVKDRFDPERVHYLE